MNITLPQNMVVGAAFTVSISANGIITMVFERPPPQQQKILE